MAYCEDNNYLHTARGLQFTNGQKMTTMLTENIEELQAQEPTIKEERKKILKDLAQSIADQLAQGQEAKIIFVCTHNSRRSQLAELWLRVAAVYFGLAGINTFSGGTEATAFNPRMVQALERAGFSLIGEEGETMNPRYTVKGAGDMESQRMFSKKYDDPSNPQSDFLAVMVCTQADEACPFIPGAIDRISLPYIDPKRADNTSQETNTYDNTVDEIGREMVFVASRIKKTKQAN